MNPADRNLEMDRSISRRDLLLGMGAFLASTFMPGRAFADEMLRLERTGGPGYPPGLTGMRGSHVGSFEIAHQLAREGRRDWGPVEEPDADLYDLVVVGGGVSGLAAAHLNRKENPSARILILDNHDDFGGHAKRNELQAPGRNISSANARPGMKALAATAPIPSRRSLREIERSIPRLRSAGFMVFSSWTAIR